MNVSVQQALTTGARRLSAAGIEGAPRDARLLMAAALGLAPGRITLHLHDALAPTDEAAFLALIDARAQRRPLSHLLGSREFFGRRFEVSPDVLDPRPETETLIAAALEQPFSQVLDLGTGSGAILLTLLAERPDAQGMGSDLSEAALAIAQRNAQALGLAGRCTLVASDWFTDIAGHFDLIVSNPPYIAEAEMAALAPELRHEPRLALTDGADGLSAYRVLAAGAGAHLAPGGRIMVEIGWQQGRAVAALFAGAGFGEVVVLPDLDGRDRVVAARNLTQKTGK